MPKITWSNYKSFGIEETPPLLGKIPKQCRTFFEDFLSCPMFEQKIWLNNNLIENGRVELIDMIRRCLARQGFFSWALEALLPPTQPPTLRSLSYDMVTVLVLAVALKMCSWNTYILMFSFGSSPDPQPQPYVSSARCELIFKFRRRVKLRIHDKSIRLPSGLIRTGLFVKFLHIF